jgi:protocatechuate 3,4-dioxygenase beta subunit
LLLIRGALTGLRPQNVTNFEKGTIHGQVKDADGKPVPGAEVSRGAKDSPGSHKQTTDASGFFTFADVTPGSHQIQATAGGRTGSATVVVRGSAQAEVEVKVGAAPADQAATEKIVVSVVDANSQAVPNAAVVLDDGLPGKKSATTDNQGKAAFDKVVPGDHSLTATAGALKGSVKVTVKKGTVATATIQVQ